jgi:hypothetical protein
VNEQGQFSTIAATRSNTIGVDTNSAGEPIGLVLPAFSTSLSATIPITQEKTVSTAPTPTENVIRGTLLALLVVPVGIFVYCLIASIGFVASIVSFGVAFGAYWLYQRGAGGVITRAGAWVVTAIVAVTIILSLYVWLLWAFAGAGAKAHGTDPWTFFQSPNYWAEFNYNLPANLSHLTLTIVLSLALGALGAFRLLRRAFAATSTGSRLAYAPPATAVPQSPVVPNDIDSAPTGSADDKTAPPAPGV